MTLIHGTGVRRVPEDDHTILVRLDERSKRIESQLSGFVTRDQFAPVARIAYGIVSAALLAVVYAVLQLVVVKK